MKQRARFALGIGVAGLAFVLAASPVLAGQTSQASQAKLPPAVAQAVKAKPGVDLNILPPAVLNAFKTAYPTAVIMGASKETEKGVTYYEVESVDGKMNRDLLYTADGKAVEVEESVAPGALPPAVLKALDKAYPGCKILKAEDMLKDGKKLFELQIQVKDKKMAVTLDPSGTIIE